MQHAPARRSLADYPNVPLPTPASEIDLIQAFARTKVIGLTINHESMTDAEVSAAIILYELELGIPATDALTRSSERLVDMVCGAFPAVEAKLARGSTAALKVGSALHEGSLRPAGSGMRSPGGSPGLV